MLKIITVPLFVLLPRKTKPPRKVIINLNNYPHWSYFLYNDIKKQYKENLAPKLEGLKLSTPIGISYTLYRGNMREGDRMNVLSVHDKFFCDALTSFGCIPDDSDEFIVDHYFETGIIDKEDPRVEVTIQTYETT